MTKKWAIISGASAGIGWSTALELAKVGYNLCLIARRQERLEELKQQILSQSKVSVECYSFDLQVKEEIDNFFRNQNQRSSQQNILNYTEILINSAGLAKGVEKIQEAHTQDWDEMINTNVRGLLYLTRGLLPFLIKNKSGHIVNIGSVAGRWVYPGGGVYCASKFAVRAISEGLRMDLLGQNIRVTNIEPGMVQTEFSEVRFNGDKNKALDVYKGLKPLLAKDVAEAIVWCLGRPAHVNIQELVLFPTDQAAVGQVHRS